MLSLARRQGAGDESAAAVTPNGGRPDAVIDPEVPGGDSLDASGDPPGGGPMPPGAGETDAAPRA